MFDEDWGKDDPPITEEVIAKTLGVPLLELAANQCRYPIGMSGVALFCGDIRSNPKSSFCDHHHALCWVKPRSR